MSYHPALLQLLGTCPCPPPVTAAQGREERKHDHFSHCRLQKWEIFFFASQHKNPISRMPVRCSLKEGDMTKGVQRLKLQLQCKPAIVMRRGGDPYLCGRYPLLMCHLIRSGDDHHYLFTTHPSSRRYIPLMGH
ncbi:uncharacterized protein M8220_003781 isoform 2-T2 [Acridotheres tristis]